MYLILFLCFPVCVQDHTLVGRPNAATQQDIQLSGLGIMPEHAVVDVANNEVYITPLDGARYVLLALSVCLSICLPVCLSEWGGDIAQRKSTRPTARRS